MIYGTDALRRLRRKQQEAEAGVEHGDTRDHAWIGVPPDAPTDDATITVWNGERFVAYDEWRRARPIGREAPQEAAPAIPASATCLAGKCGTHAVWIARDGGRWLMYVGSRTAGGRLRDFATPYLDHAIRAAEQWYGAASGGWHVEEGSDGKVRGSQTADLPPQDSTAEETNGWRGPDDVDLDGIESGRK